VTKRFLAMLLVGSMVLLSLAITNPAQAQLMANVAVASEVAAATETVQDWLTQLEKDVLPKLETILSPEQQKQFKSFIGEGRSFRKTFKSLTLTPQQKTQIKDLLSRLPKKDAFASLTLEQKKRMFLKRQEMFKPTPADITGKINQGMNFQTGSGAVLEVMNAQLRDKLEGLHQWIPGAE
jgi:Spy/CpxP family protein refolding chaperone